MAVSCVATNTTIAEATENLDWEEVLGWFVLGAVIWLVVLKAALEGFERYLMTKYPIKAEEDEEGAEDGLGFCYTCAADRKTEKVSIGEAPPGPHAVAPTCAWQCQSCTRFLHEQDWLPDLVCFAEDYHDWRKEQEGGVPLNPDFPLTSFATTGDILAYLVVLFSGLFNAYTIAEKFATKGVKERQRDVCYDFTLAWLARGEFILVCVAALRMVWLSARTTLWYRRRRPLRVFAGLLFSNMDMLADANALAAMRWWNVSRLLGTANRAAYVHHSGPAAWDTVLLVAQFVWLIPVLAILIIGPAAALLVRVMQLEPCTTTYIANWGSTEWILFLSFLNNFRYLVSQPDLMSRLGGHLLKSKVYFLFAEVMDVTDGVMQWVRCVTLVTTSAPSECYELFKGDSGIWRARDTVRIEGVVGRRASHQVPPLDDGPAGARWASKDPSSADGGSASGRSPKGPADTPRGGVKAAGGVQAVRGAVRSRRRTRKLGVPGSSAPPSGA